MPAFPVSDDELERARKSEDFSKELSSRLSPTTIDTRELVPGNNTPLGSHEFCLMSREEARGPPAAPSSSSATSTIAGSSRAEAVRKGSPTLP